MKYALITTNDGSNPGDDLLTENAKSILNKEFNGECVCSFGFAENPEKYIDQINAADICFLSTISYDFGSNQYNSLIKKINIPVINLTATSAMQRYDAPIGFRPSAQQQQTIGLANKYSDEIPVRDVFTKYILENNIKNVRPVKVTGDLGCFNFGNPVKKMKQPTEIKKILVTVGHRPCYYEQMVELVSYLRKKFPNAEIVYSTNTLPDKGRGVFDFSKTKLKDLNIRVLDSSVSCDKLDVYKDFDLHVGYRLHGHIKSLSVGVPSILIAEDFRGIGQKYTLGNAGVFAAFEFDFHHKDSNTDSGCKDFNTKNILKKIFLVEHKYNPKNKVRKSCVRFLGIKFLTYTESSVRLLGIKFKKRPSLIKDSKKLIAEIDKYIDMSIYTNWSYYNNIPMIINDLYHNSFLPVLRNSINNALNKNGPQTSGLQENSPAPSLDVVVLTYNRAELFEKSLRSVCDQTYQDFTVKVLNNGSTDNTEEVFNRVKAEYPHRRFDYLKLKENHRDDYYIEQRNKFITADYVIVFHDDDLMHPRYVEHLMKIIPEHPEYVLLGCKKKIIWDNNLEWDEPTGFFVVKNIKEYAKAWYKADQISYPSICYKSNYLKLTPYREDLYGNAGDVGLIMDFAEQGKICELQDRFLHYRKHQGADLRPRSLQQRMNLASRITNCFSPEDNDLGEFYNFIDNMSSRDPLLHYAIVSKYRHVFPGIDKIFKKKYNKNKIKRKAMFYKICFLLSRKIHMNSKRYAKRHYKLMKAFRIISNCETQLVLKQKDDLK